MHRLSKHRLDRLRQEHGMSGQNGGQDSAGGGGECYRGFSPAYWAFTKQPLTQTLSKLNEQEEQEMLQVFQSVLTYAGLGQNGKKIILIYLFSCKI